jgi:hypothetical protein
MSFKKSVAVVMEVNTVLCGQGVGFDGCIAVITPSALRR